MKFQQPGLVPSQLKNLVSVSQLKLLGSKNVSNWSSSWVNEDR